VGRSIHDWQAIQLYHDDGHGFVECSRRFGFGHTAWIKAIKRGALRVAPSRFRDRRRLYDWAEVQAYYDHGRSYCDTAAHFGFCSAAWYKAIQPGEIKPRTRTVPLEIVLRSLSGRWCKKAKLLREGHLANRCRECGISEWQGKPLAVQIDHINGIGSDWRIENLRMLCPNCHSQTDTFAGRNVRRERTNLQECPLVA
jgi:5-methylcytosine-specific restriction endonuclease McrA